MWEDPRVFVRLLRIFASSARGCTRFKDFPDTIGFSGNRNKLYTPTPSDPSCRSLPSLEKLT